MYAEMTMGDIVWLDVQRVHGEEAVIKHRAGLDAPGSVLGQKRKLSAVEPDAMGNSLGGTRASDRFVRLVGSLKV